ncbi:MAG: glycosyltransferase family 4 protein [Fibrobacter sp.]|nr:glycosyltransferase family 4 protein [Fibrobacter sp.]
MRVIIVSPSLDPTKNVSGLSAVTRFIIANNPHHNYVHFELGRKDIEKGGIYRVNPIIRKYKDWKRLLKTYPDAIVHYNFPLEKLGITRDTPFMHAALQNGNKMVIHIHGGVYLTSKIIPFPFRQMLNYVFSWPVPFITLSETEAETLRKRFHAKHVVSLPNCIDLKDAQSFQRKYKDASTPLTLGYLGRIAKTKGMDDLLQACCRLKERHIPFCLKIAGAEEQEGQYLPQFSNRLGNQFAYAGIVSGEKKKSFLQSLDVLAMPTFFEGLPMSLLECMSYGVVPVITPVGSIPSVVTEGQNGILIKVKDAQSIVDAITYLHTHRSELEQMSKSSCNYIYEHFDSDSYIDKLNNIYEL